MKASGQEIMNIDCNGNIMQQNRHNLIGKRIEISIIEGDICNSITIIKQESTKYYMHF